MLRILDRIISLWRIRRLKQEYFAWYGPASAEAEKTPARQMALIKSKRPDQTEEWYLEKIIYDLQKDRRR